LADLSRHERSTAQRLGSVAPGRNSEGASLAVATSLMAVTASLMIEHAGSTHPEAQVSLHAGAGAADAARFDAVPRSPDLEMGRIVRHVGVCPGALSGSDKG
jgi:hypothetical protein